MARTRAWRRFQTRRIQKKRRIRCVWWWGWSLNGEQLWTDQSNHFGMLKKHHFGCGCPTCKPWKHKLESKFTFSERKSMLIEFDEY